ncbi:hypothetical protein niasHT_021727 [Heterodera trifolii]|uniref:Uncharacterized protein n=1 Tax=Heterodera trifolii TaxID=157864 RepID=A0ABD2KTF1_9BILA
MEQKTELFSPQIFGIFLLFHGHLPALASLEGKSLTFSPLLALRMMLAPNLPPGEEKRHVNEGQDEQQQKEEHYGGRGKGGHAERSVG